MLTPRVCQRERVSVCVCEWRTGTFLESLFTMMQVVSGDSWSSAVTRSLFPVKPQPQFLTQPQYLRPERKACL